MSHLLEHPGPRQEPGQRDPGRPDLICLSHLRWDFVFQRPQHLMSRFAAERRVFFLEEPVACEGPDRLEVETTPEGVIRVVPRLARGDGRRERKGGRDGGGDPEARQRRLLDGLLRERGLRDFVLWYYTPMALGYSRHLRPRAVVYDAMDELSLFALAPPELAERERELLRRADVVFAGGPSLFEARRDRHPNVHCFPSSIDAAHFRRARRGLDDPEDQTGVPRPRLGFFGVLDERLDRDLLAALADLRPDWHVVMVGPVVKIDPASLPRRANIHYLGLKPYAELPRYIAGWEAAVMPWILNDATRFISPTKTPEYLAAGRPVVSTPVPDVVRTYGPEAGPAGGLVRIADTPEAWVAELEDLLATTPEERDAWLRRVDAFLARTSWERTWRGMRDLVSAAVA